MPLEISDVIGVWKPEGHQSQTEAARVTVYVIPGDLVALTFRSFPRHI